MSIKMRQDAAEHWFKQLRKSICDEMTAIEREMKSDAEFVLREWRRDGGGGGLASSLRGEVFEKAGVNISTVFGDFSDDAMTYMKFSQEQKKFWASGISIVIHAKSPLVPSAHMNTRFLHTDRDWFGGVADITQAVPDAEAEAMFHDELKSCCENFQVGRYEEFRQNCDEYFYIPHRKKGRGSSGIFYDYLNSGNWNKDFALTKAIGMAFRKKYFAIVRKRMHEQWTNEQKQLQLQRRALYVEFNLLYDRGTKFGLMTNGDAEAILMSMPPEACW